MMQRHHRDAQLMSVKTPILHAFMQLILIGHLGMGLCTTGRLFSILSQKYERMISMTDTSVAQGTGLWDYHFEVVVVTWRASKKSTSGRPKIFCGGLEYNRLRQDVRIWEPDNQREINCVLYKMEDGTHNHFRGYGGQQLEIKIARKLCCMRHAE